MTRYYERESYKSVDQMKRPRLEKILLIIVTIMYIGANIAYLVIKVNAESIRSKEMSIPLSNKFLNENVITILKEATFYIQLLDAFLSQLGIALVLLAYFIVLLIKRSKVPIHTVLKILLFYIALKVVPSPTFLRSVDLDGLSQKMSVPMEYIMWSFAVIPFLCLIPAIPFLLSRTPKDTVQTLFGLGRSYLELILKLLVYPDKMYRLLSTISSLLGTCAFVLILLSITMPWSTIRFRPNDDIRPTINVVKNFIEKVDGILEEFKKVTDKVCDLATKAMNSEVIRAAMEKFDEAKKALDFVKKAVEIAKKVKDGTEETVKKVKKGIEKIIPGRKKREAFKFDPDDTNKMQTEKDKLLRISKKDTSCAAIDVLEKFSCDVYTIAYIASIILMAIPFVGIVAKIVLTAARVARKVFLLLKQFMRLADKLQATRQYLNEMFNTIFKDPIFEWTVTFKPEKYMLLFLFPSLITGLFFISTVFWKRRNAADVKLRVIVSTIAFVFLFTNGAVLAYVWISKWVTETALQRLPLIDVEVEELEGWNMIKLAYVLSTASSLLLLVYSSGEIFQMHEVRSLKFLIFERVSFKYIHGCSGITVSACCRFKNFESIFLAIDFHPTSSVLFRRMVECILLILCYLYIF